jgi:preprotein translocase subunit SecE
LRAGAARRRLNSPPARRISPEPDVEDRSMAGTNPLQFIQQTRAEVAKITWPNRREVLVTTVMVLIMSTLTAIFFFFVDWMIRSGLKFTLSAFGS